MENGEEEMEEEEEDELPSTPEPRKWECLGSDLDIIDGYFMKERGLVRNMLLLKMYFSSTVEGLGSGTHIDGHFIEVFRDLIFVVFNVVNPIPNINS